MGLFYLNVWFLDEVLDFGFFFLYDFGFKSENFKGKISN